MTEVITAIKMVMLASSFSLSCLAMASGDAESVLLGPMKQILHSAD